MANETLEMIRTRRSTRVFKKTVPAEELLNAVLEAGRYAPSGGNSQTARFFCVTDPAVLDRLAEIVLNSFASMEEMPGINQK